MSNEIMNPFRYYRVSSPAEASARIRDSGEDETRLIAGGTALVIMMKEKILSPSTLLDISSIDSMRGITYSDEKGLCIGSMATHYEIETSSLVSKYYPSLKETFHTIGNVRVRMAGTIGGNLAYAEPQCNPPAILSALSATVHTIKSSGDERAIPAEDFIRGIFESALESAEIITSITVPSPKPNSASSFLKFTTKSSTDKPTSTAAVYIEGDSKLLKNSRIVVGAVGPKTFRCFKAEELVNSSSLSSLDCRKIAKIASEEIEPMDDLYGPTWYKKRVTESIVNDALARARGELAEKVVDIQH